MAKDQYVLGDEPPGDQGKAVGETLPEVVVELVGTIEDVPAGTIKNAIVKIGVTDAALADLRAKVNEALAKYDGSKDAYELVRRVRLDIVKLRVAVEKEAKEGRAEALAVQRLWLGAEKKVTGFYSEDEQRLADAEFQYTEKIRLAAEEKQRIERERVNALFVQLQAVDWPGNELMVAQMKPEEFGDALAKATESFEAVLAARKAEEDRKKREEEEAAERQKKLDEDNAKLEEDRKKLEAEKAALEAEKQKLKDQEDQREKDRLKKEADDLKAKNEAAEKENQRLRDLQAQKDKEEADRLKAQQAEENKKAEEKRLAELAPDKEKVVEWCRASWEFVSHVPTLRDQSLQSEVDHVAQTIDGILSDLRIKMGAGV